MVAGVVERHVCVGTNFTETCYATDGDWFTSAVASSGYLGVVDFCFFHLHADTNHRPFKACKLFSRHRVRISHCPTSSKTSIHFRNRFPLFFFTCFQNASSYLYRDAFQHLRVSITYHQLLFRQTTSLDPSKTTDTRCEWKNTLVARFFD